MFIKLEKGTKMETMQLQVSKQIKCISEFARKLIGATSRFEEDDELTLQEDCVNSILTTFAAMVSMPAPISDMLPKSATLVDLERLVSEYGFELKPVKKHLIFDEGHYLASARFLILKNVPEEYTASELETILKVEKIDEEVAETLVPIKSKVEVSYFLGRKDTDCMVLFTDGTVNPETGVLESTSKVMKIKEVMEHVEDCTVLEIVKVEKLPQEEASKFGWAWFKQEIYGKDKGPMRAILGASLLIQAIGLGLPFATQHIVDDVIRTHSMSTLQTISAAMLVSYLISGLLSFLRQQTLIHQGKKLDVSLSNTVMNHLVKLPLSYFEKRPTGVVINRLHNVERVREFLTNTVPLLFVDIPIMLVFLGIMLLYSWQLSLVVFGFISFMSVLGFIIGPAFRENINTQSQLGAKVQGFLTEHVASYETIKSLQLEEKVLAEFASLNESAQKATAKTKEIGNLYGSLIQMADPIMMLLVMYIGATLAMNSNPDLPGGFSIGMLMAFSMFAQRVTQPMLKLSGAWQEYQQVKVCVGQIGDLMNEMTEHYSIVPSSVGSDKVGIEVKNLGFSYGQNLPMLYENLNFDVKPGEVVLITGESGSGKSTCAKILLGLLRSYKGSISINGRDSRSMSVNEIRAHFSVVLQETVLYKGTITENLLKVKPSATFEECAEACKQAEIHTTIESLENGYKTEVGERGVGLSGGQKQRIGIARALLKDSSTIILDEAISGLDDKSSELFAETINNKLRGKVTVIFITHKIPPNLIYDKRIILGKRGEDSSV